MKKIMSEAKYNFLKIEETYSKYATKSTSAIRIDEIEEDIRSPFFRDADRILHSLSYTRYIDKTQVYSYNENDHISKRIIHVQLVSKIARTIGRALSLNTDLIEAISLGHDIGHTPLGHTGEKLLNEITKRELNECFSHNIQSVRELMEVENGGAGLNLTVQVLDGIMCHNGEVLTDKYETSNKTVQDFLAEYKNAYKDITLANKNNSMTLEGCVVRISDIIAYIGRDLEDAIRLEKLDRNTIPKDIEKILGNNNKDIVNTIILDIIENSINKPYLKMSKKVYKALAELIKFNYENIYNKSMTPEKIEYYRIGMNKIYLEYLKALDNNDTSNIIYKIFINYQNTEYIKNTSNKRKVIDFIAGMTDDLFYKEINKK